MELKFVSKQRNTKECIANWSCSGGPEKRTCGDSHHGQHLLVSRREAVQRPGQLERDCLCRWCSETARCQQKLCRRSRRQTAQIAHFLGEPGQRTWKETSGGLHCRGTENGATKTQKTSERALVVEVNYGKDEGKTDRKGATRPRASTQRPHKGIAG